MITRKKTKKIKVGNIYIGGDAPIVVQSMANTRTKDIEKTVNQIKDLEEKGCELIRVGVPEMEDAKALGEIRKKINIPLVADIHFSHELALEAINQGIDKLRINPGNIGKEEKIKKVVTQAKNNNIPIRIGINSGSLEKDLLKKYKEIVTPEAMVESAMRHIKILEKYNFYDIVISLKASDIQRTVKAYKLLSKKVNYPLHLGITEAGTALKGTIVSSIGLGILLYEGIGDTLRVSLSDDPGEEVKVGWEILKSLNIRNKGITITSCPTCARTEIDVIGLAQEIEKKTQNIDKYVHVAIMGCIVNGPGEAKESDLGIIGIKGNLAIITKKGKTIKKVSSKNIVEEFLKEIEKYTGESL